MKNNKMSKEYKVPDGKVLVLRTCNKDYTSWGGFKWNGVGKITKAPDWEPTKECGNGLHGLLWGEGLTELLGSNGDVTSTKNLWTIIEVDKKGLVNIDNEKVKFEQGKMVFAGERDECINFLFDRAPKNKRIPFVEKFVDKRKKFFGGDHCKLIGDHNSICIAKKCSFCFGKHYSIAIVFGHGIAIVENNGYAEVEFGKAIAGNFGSAHIKGTGIAEVGIGGIVKGFNGSTLRILSSKNNYVTKRIPSFYDKIKDDDVKPNIWYKLNDRDEFVETTTEDMNDYPQIAKAEAAKKSYNGRTK